MEQIINTIPVIIGFILGLLSSALTFYFSRRIIRIDYKKGVGNEIYELNQRIIITVVQISDFLGTSDRDLLEWARDNLSIYYNNNHSPLINDIVDIIDQKLQYPDKDLNKLRNYSISKNNRRGMSLKKYNLPFTENNIHNIYYLNKSNQFNLISFLDIIRVSNEEIDRYLYYFDKTFDVECVRQNDDRIQENLKNSLHGLRENLKKAAELALNIINDLK